MSERKRLPGQVVVITGASSGIGRLTALEFARGGAHVYAVARNQTALERLATSSAALAGTITPVVTDVSNGAALRALAQDAVARHGRLDTWINGAGVAIWARAEDTDPAEVRRVLEVNVLGVVNGTLAALEAMTPVDGGTIVNIGSIESERAMPLQSAYAASKHAVKGFTEALRAELQHEGRNIDIVLVMPSSINTPIFRHARARLGGRLPRPHPPVYDPAAVSQALVAVAQKPVRSVIVGGAGAGLVFIQRLSPGLADRALALTGWSGQVSDRPDDGRDNLDGPMDEHGTARGAFGAGARRRSFYTRFIALHPVAVRGVALGAVAGIGLFLRRRTKGHRH